MNRWIAAHSPSISSVTRYYYGVFNSKEEAWIWINKRDLYRKQEWNVIKLENEDVNAE